MIETLKLISVADPADQHEMTIHAVEDVGMGYDTSKQLVHGAIDGQAGTVLLRPYTAAHVDAWLGYSAAGMGVTSSAWHCRRQGRRLLAVTDIKADESEVYGKGVLSSYVNPNDPTRRRTRSRPAIDRIFMHMMDEGCRKDIEDLVHAQTDRANANDLLLPGDDPFELHIHPDQTRELVTLDLDLASASAAQTVAEWGSGDFREMNRGYATNFFDILVLIHGHLQKAEIA